MLKIHVVRQGGHHYYVDDLVPGRAEGTLVAGESPGAWTGTGARALGVADAVEASSFGEVLEGRHPRWGTSLRALRGDRTVAGFDLTFCAPKSVSILHLLAPGEIAGQVGDGHHAAVAEATDYLQRAALRVRRTRSGRLDPDAVDRHGGRHLRPPHQSGPRSSPPQPPGGGQRRRGRRRCVVDGGQQADLRSPGCGRCASTTPGCAGSCPNASARRGRFR